MNKINYVDCWQTIIDTFYFLYLFIGARGIGKTYSVLKGLINQKSKFLYVRLTDTELKNSVSPLNNPFKTLNTDLKRDIQIIKVKGADTYGILDNETGNIIGTAGALSVFGKYRGVDFSDVDYIIFDEFIPKGYRKANKNQDIDFFDMLETVNRNRELQGKSPIKVILLSNSNSLQSPILNSLGLPEVINQMRKNNNKIYTDNNRGIYLQLFKNIDVSNAKAETSLYKLTRGTDFYKMAIENDFYTENFNNVKKVPYRNLIPWANLENMYFYDIKGSSKIYISSHKSVLSKAYIFTKETVNDFKKQYGFNLQYLFDKDLILYEDYNIKNDFYNMLLK